MDYHPPNGSTRPSYKTKLREMQKLIRRYVILNAALCDQVSETQEQLVIAKENRRFLLERLQRLSSAQQESVPQAPPKTVTLNLPNVYPSSSQGSSLSMQEEEEELIPMPLPLPVSLPFSLPTPEPTSLPKKKPKPKRSTLLKSSNPSDFYRAGSVGFSVFPLTLRGLTVYSVGAPKDYLTKEVNGVELLVPSDFHSVRIYGMLSDPERRCRYDCRVHSQFTPSRTFCQLFEISSHELDTPLRGQTADACHAALLRMINEAMGAQVTTQLPKGEWFFGYALPAVRKHMKSSITSRKTDAEGCVIDEENDDTLHFEALQRSIAVARFEAHTSANLSRADQTPTPEHWEV